MSTFVAVQAGPNTLVQDLGRPGLAHLGMGAAGAMDRAALALANRLVGNAPGAAVFEILFGNASFATDEETWIAVTGAWGSVTAGGRVVQPHTATMLAAGETLAFGQAASGIRYYLAVRGGIDAPPILGSRSRDTLAGIGSAPLVDGQSIPIGPEPEAPIPPIDLVPVDAPTNGEVTLELRPGPRRAWFTDDSWDLLMAADWRVSPRSDRSGIRIEGPALQRRNTGELPSEGMLPGAIQVSPDGAPTILAVDNPVTGGYPVIAVVTDESLDALAQLRPGQPLRFRLATGR
ncbi:MAG: biotin-dependent carboxyltransferase family protein [Cryobacterium sp.]|nr:biotin-dependent carboxyltransferase family protein [Cryobacterium sp.]